MLNAAVAQGFVSTRKQTPFHPLGDRAFIYDARELNGLSGGGVIDAVANQAPGQTISLTGSGSARPTYQTGVFSSKYPVIRTDGSNDELLSSANPFTTGNTSKSLYVVFTPRNNNGPVCGFGSSGTGANAGIGCATDQIWFPAGGSDIYLYTGTVSTSWRLICVLRYDAANSRLHAAVFGDVSVATDVAFTANWGNGGFVLGQNRPGAFFFGAHDILFTSGSNSFDSEALMLDLVDFLAFDTLY